MKFKSYVLLSILFLTSTEILVAQSKTKLKTLTIQVTKSNPPVFVVKFDGKVLGNESSFSPDTAYWTIKVDYAGSKKYSIILKNNEGDQKMVIDDFTKTYEVANDQVKDESFTIPKNFNIALAEDDAETTLAHEHTLSYSKSKSKNENTEKKEVDQYALGSAIYDAHYLKTGSSSKIKLAILAHYADCTAQSDSVLKAYKNNKFIPSSDIRTFLKIKTSQSMGGTALKNTLSSIGGLDVTNMADGLAKFLVKRTKEELNITFFQNFRDFLKKDEYKDLQTVFPETNRTFNIIGDEIYNFDRYLQTLRESFKSDLVNLTTNLKTIVDNHPLFFEGHPELRGIFFSGLYIAESIRDKVHPGDILADYPIGCDSCLENLSLPVSGSIQSLRLFSESLRDSSESDTDYWVSGTDLKKIFKNTQITTYYFGLTYQLAKSKYNGIPYGKNISLVSLLDSLGPEKQTAYQNYLLRFIDKTDKLTKMLKEYSKPANDSLALEQYYNYFKSSVDLLEYAVEIGKLPGMPTKLSSLKELTKDYFDITNTTSDLVLDINRKNYSSAVRNAVHIYEVIKVRQSKSHEEKLKSDLLALSDKVEVLKKEINSLKSDTSKKPILEEKVTTLSGIESTFKLTESEFKRECVSKNAMDKLFKYGTFMASLLTAETSDQVEEVIESFALPAGSASVKRETDFNVALNGYLGMYGGRERIRGLDTKKHGTYGLTAPIGVSISRGHSIFFGGKRKHAWSSSLFISLIDLGAIASFRFQSETSSEIVSGDTTTTTIYELPQIKLKDIISPGAFFSIGIPKTPLSINMGAQIGPNLRKVAVSSTDNTVVNDYADRMYWRLSVSLVVDIPILNFYSKSRER